MLRLIAAAVLLLLASSVVAQPDPLAFFTLSSPVGSPALAARDGRIAFIVADEVSGARIAPFKESGRLFLGNTSVGAMRPLDGVSSAHDPVWSPDGATLAFFDGFGPDRDLCLLTPGQPDGIRRFALPGDTQRKSARFFPPVWIDGGDLVVASAFPRAIGPAMDQPWSLGSADEKLPLDAHFRDDTLWQLQRIDPLAGGSQDIGPLLALRELSAGPAARTLLVAAAEEDSAGRFVGDRWLRPLEYWLLRAGGDALQRLPAPAQEALGWLRTGEMLTQQAGQLYAGQPDGATSLLPLDAAGAIEAVVGGGEWLLAQSAGEVGRHDAGYLIPPPRAATLRWHDRATGRTREVITAAELEIIQLLDLGAGWGVLAHVRDLDAMQERILLVGEDGGRELLFEAPGGVSGLATDGRGRAAFFLENARGDRALRILSLEEEPSRVLWQYSPDSTVLNGSTPVEPTLLRYELSPTETGRALLYLPSGWGRAGEKRGLVVTAYGRLTHRRHRFQAEAQLHVARGYAYLMVDVFPLRGAVGEAYSSAVPAAVQAVSDAFGDVTGPVFHGGSLGGFAGFHLLAHTSLFAAAALRAGPAEFAMNWASGRDRDAELLEYIVGGPSPLENRALYDDNSPLWKSGSIDAPVLLLHGSEDAQVALAQSVMMFQALRRQNKVAELRVYPRADHSIIRGSSANLEDYYEQLFRWWQRWLPPGDSHAGDAP